MTSEVLGEPDTFRRVEFQDFELKSLKAILGEEWDFNESRVQYLSEVGLWEILITKDRAKQSNNNSICVQRDALIRLELSDIDHVNIDMEHNEAHFIACKPQGEYSGTLPLYRIFNRGFNH